MINIIFSVQKIINKEIQYAEIKGVRRRNPLALHVVFCACALFLFSFSQEISAQTYDELVLKSYDYLEKNDLPAAEIALQEAMRKEPANPGNVLLFFNLGTIQRRLGDNEEAIISYTAALARAPQNITFLSNRASLFAEMGQSDNAVIDYTTLLDVDPNNEDALYQRGLLSLKNKNYESAQADFERIIEINPNTINGRRGIASLCKFRNEFEDAEKIYYFLIDKMPEDPNLYADRAELYLLMKKNGRAMGDINKAISLQPEDKQNPYFYMLRARIKLLQYEKKSALNDINKAVELGYDLKEAQELKTDFGMKVDD